MEFSEELYIGKSITDEASVVYMLKNGKVPAGIFCVCKKDNGRFLYEIVSAHELLKDRNKDRYTVYGIAAGKQESFELLRFILEDRHEY
ncbi:MAG: hypothetical protein LUE88_01485 [Clostridiales bacterium]|nr:hypothetical protein [Clostridiales bacterium]